MKNKSGSWVGKCSETQEDGAEYKREQERITWEELEHNYPLINSYNTK